MAYKSKDRIALEELNNAAHNARRVLGREHPMFARALVIMRETDAMVDECAPITEAGK